MLPLLIARLAHEVLSREQDVRRQSVVHADQIHQSAQDYSRGLSSGGRWQQEWGSKVHDPGPEVSFDGDTGRVVHRIQLEAESAPAASGLVSPWPTLGPTSAL